MKNLKPDTMWGAMWRSNSRLDGKIRHVMYENCFPVLFTTKKASREWIKKNHGDIATAKDLRTEPHGWRMPIPIRVQIMGMPK